MQERLIDANALIELAQNHVDHTVDINDIARFPTASPRDWTPCAEGQPTPQPNDTLLRDVIPYRITYENNSADRKCVECGYILDRDGKPIWYSPVSMSEIGRVVKVIAWQTLPAPYRADDTTGKVKEDAE